MSCKSVGVSWSLLGSIFHNNSGHQLHRHLGYIQIWKSVAELCWVKCPPLEEDIQSVFGTPPSPKYHIWATRSLRNYLECICLPVFNRTIRFQDNETVHVVCNTQSWKMRKEICWELWSTEEGQLAFTLQLFPASSRWTTFPLLWEFHLLLQKISISYIQKQPPSSYPGGRNLSDSS